MIDFKLFGIPIRVEAMFWITLGILGFLSFGIETSEQMLKIALFLVAGFISIIIHELGHGLMIKKYGLPTQIVLSSFGGYATHPSGILNRKQDFLVTLAGPLIQLILGALIFYGSPYLNTPPGSLINFFFFILFWISVVWALLNCLPVLPLDGGRMLAAAMGPRRKKDVLVIGMITAVLVAAYAFMNGYIFGAIFMGMFFYQNLQAYKQTY